MSSAFAYKKSFIAPRIPVHGILGVLKEVRELFICKTVGSSHVISFYFIQSIGQVIPLQCFKFIDIYKIYS